MRELNGFFIKRICLGLDFLYERVEGIFFWFNFFTNLLEISYFFNRSKVSSEEVERKIVFY